MFRSIRASGRLVLQCFTSRLSKVKNDDVLQPKSLQERDMVTCDSQQVGAQVSIAAVLLLEWY